MMAVELIDPPTQPTADDLELRAIAREAGAIETEQRLELNPDDPTAQPPAPVDHTQEARDLVEFAYTSLEPLYPSLAKVYTEEARQRIAVAGGRLLRKYNVDMAAIFGQWGDEIAFAMVALPLVVPTVQAIRADRAKAEAIAKAPPPAHPNPPPSQAQADMQERAADAPPPAPNPLAAFGQ